MPQMMSSKIMAASDNLWAMQPQAFSAFMAAIGDQDARAQSAFSENSQNAAPYEAAGNVAVIAIDGPILRQACPFWGIAGQHEIRAALDAAQSDPAISAILFAIHSPGGQARGVKELADAIAASKKPCAAFVDGLCASAAYWLAAATGRIYAGPSSEVGSIGVIMRHVDQSGMNAQFGLNFTYITAGAYKACGNPDAALSDADRAVLQARVDAIYEMFCADVAAHMGLDPAARPQWADGRDFLAAQALGLGLVTAIVGSRQEAVGRLQKEFFMDKTELAQKHPDLLASIQEEAKNAALADQACKLKTAAETARAETLAIAEIALGKEAAGKIRALAATGMTPEQLAQAAAIFGAPQADAASYANKREEMLQAIKDATPRPASGAVMPNPQDAAHAAIERIGKM